MNVVVDASVVAKWFIREPGSDAAREILLSDDILIAPAHALAETGEVLVTAFRRGLIGEQQLNEAALALPNSFAQVPLDDIFDRALAIALEVATSLYDALYIASAERWDTYMVTADRRLLGKVRGSKYEIFMRGI